MALADTLFLPIIMLFDRIAMALGPKLRRVPDGVALGLLTTVKALGLATMLTDVDPNDSGRNRWLWDSAKKRGIRMRQFRLLGRPDGISFFAATLDGKTVVFEGLPRPDQGDSSSLIWMDNKAVLKKKFLAAGIPMAQGRACFSYKEALKTMERVGPPVITKPHIGSRSRHSTVGIKTPAELKIGFEKAKRLSPWVVVEQELQGYLFRVLLVSGKVMAIIRREQAHVAGPLHDVIGRREQGRTAEREYHRVGVQRPEAPVRQPGDVEVECRKQQL